MKFVFGAIWILMGWSQPVHAGPLPGSWHTDPSLFPKAYGIIADEHLMHPVDMSDWPVKIDSSHQLFVDDYLIASMKNVRRQVHPARKHRRNPLIVPDNPCEGQGGMNPLILRNEATGRFQHWYSAYHTLAANEKPNYITCYAESEDGIHWTKPDVNLFKYPNTTANNIVVPDGRIRALFHEPRDPDPLRRYKALVLRYPNQAAEGYYLHTSPDGIRWTQARQEPVAWSLKSVSAGGGYKLPQSGIGDSSSFRWDERLNKYIGDVKLVLPPIMRSRGFMESEDLMHWTRPRMMFYPDGLDDPDSQIYGHIGFAYESMWLGFLRVYHEVKAPASAKQTTVELTASRDGRHWTRAGHREEVLPLGGSDDWDAHYHNPGTPPLLVGDQIWIYYTSTPIRENKTGQRHCLGLATLRRDGFASLNATDQHGTVLTRPLTFNGKALYVNAQISKGGYLKAELRDRVGKAVGRYTLDRCNPVIGDVLRSQVLWGEQRGIEHDSSQSLRLVFELKNAKLYAFWIE